MNRLPERFDDLRPYYDEEVPAAMQRIADNPMLLMVLQFLKKEDQYAAFQAVLRQIRTTDQLQHEVMLPLCREVVSRTMTRYTYDGVRNVHPEHGQLFVSNHRDIVMDAYLHALALVEHDLPTSHITFGSNLMEPQFVVDIGLANKMFKTVRKTSEFESFMNSSIHLSDYINWVVSHGESVWIAQRNGRTKDGIDKTEPGLLRMLLLGANKREALEYLHITPISVSYQWEPCDILKAVELLKSRGGKPYVKAKGEDLNSIITGIVSPKGNVHLSICEPVDGTRFPEHVTRSTMAEVVEEMDRKIYANYRLWDTNYLAWDLLNGSSRFAGLYSEEIREQFTERLRHAMEQVEKADRGALREIFLKIYAGPVMTSPVALK